VIVISFFFHSHALFALTNGFVVSSVMVSVISAVVFHNPSLNLIYTVFVHSQLVRVCEIFEVHVVQLVGLAEFPYATWTFAFQVSVAHVVVSVTLVHDAYAESPFILNVHHVGAVLSIWMVFDDFTIVLFHASSSA
jgi:hypothetical protein